jgi:hypothetical protein
VTSDPSNEFVLQVMAADFAEITLCEYLSIHNFRQDLHVLHRLLSSLARVNPLPQAEPMSYGVFEMTDFPFDLAGG